MGNEVGVAVTNQVEKIGQLVQQQPDGYYIIPDISLTDYDNQKVRLLNLILFDLTKRYPQYRWWTTESYAGPGLRVNWRLK